MSLPAGVELKPVTEWPNRHRNFIQPLIPGASFNVKISDFPTPEERYRKTTANLQWMIREAIAKNHRLRAMGNNWSFTRVGVSEGGIVDTVPLKQTFWLNNTMLAPAYRESGGRAETLFFTQCGLKILELQQIIEPKGKSIRASGASNGQTIAGAFSTGTHGAAFNFGSVHDQVVGLHLICGPDRHVWLERASYPIASEPFTEWLGVTEVLRDDALFNAALVSFGSFGIIHGIILEVEDKFLLHHYARKEVPYDSALINAMTRLDFSGLTSLNLPASQPDNEPYHFQLIVNPHQFPEKGAYVRILYKTPYQTTYERIPVPTGEFTYGDETMGIIGAVLDRIGPLAPLLVPPLVNALYPQALSNTNGKAGTISESFGNTSIKGDAVSAAIGIDACDSARVLDEIIALNRQTTFPGLLGLRWVKKTPATLGFTRFPITCVLELDGVESDLTRQFCGLVWNRLDALEIPFTLHWGKINSVEHAELTNVRLRRMYPGKTVDQWLTARHRLLDAPTRAVFTNGFMEQCGLDQSPPAAPLPFPLA